MMDKIDPDDLSSRIAAYAGADDDGLPTRWTPERVQERMVEAFTVIAKTAGRVGPRTHANGWPAMIREFEDYLGYDWKAYFKDRNADIARDADRNFSSLELSRADEAMNWAARYLQADPILADAIQLWAWCKANHIKIEKVLRGRCIAADRLRARRSVEADAERDRAMSVKRRTIATDIAKWANDRLATAPNAQYAARIRAGARELARKAIIKAEREMPRPSSRMRRSEVAPGKVFTNQWLDLKRKEAAATLAAMLDRDGVIVR